MAFRFAMSGGNFLDSAPSAAGIFATRNGNPNSPCPVGVSDTFAFFNGTGGCSLTTTNLGGNFSSLSAGMRLYTSSTLNNKVLIQFLDQTGAPQCDVRTNGTGQLYFTRNGSVIGATSTAAIVTGAWNFIEFFAIFSTSGAGTCTARINSQVVTTATSLTNATTTALAAQAFFQGPGNAPNGDWIRDCYVVDGGATTAPFTLTSVDAAGNFTGTITGGASNAYAGYKFTITGFTNGANNPIGAVCTGSTATTLSFSYLTTVVETHAGSAGNYGATGLQGDVKGVELFANGAGVNSAWTPNVGPFTLTSVNGSGVYQGTITGGASNAYVGYNFNVTGFVNGANNVTGGICTASSATSITLTATTVVETHAGNAAFQCIVQVGINLTGTRPNGDVAYISDSTPGDVSDFAHSTLTLSGAVLAILHLSYARKDDAGARSIAQVVLSSSATEQSPPLSLGNTYQYWLDFVEVDPNTGTAWTAAAVNSCTFGVRELT